MNAIAHVSPGAAKRRRMAALITAAVVVFGLLAAVAEPALSAVPTQTKRTGFDPATSTVVEEQTTATRKVFRNSDGSYTARLNAQPARFHGDDGKWVENDLTLVAGPDQALHAKAASKSAKLPARADGASTVESPAGPIVVRHPGASAAPAATEKARSVYRGALGGSDLVVDLTTEGFEESVVLGKPSQPTSNVLEFGLPPGLSAREALGSVEFVDDRGTVVARYGAGIAYDAKGEVTAVSIRILPPTASGVSGDGAGTLVGVEVGLAEAWARDPSRAYPLTIDPTFTTLWSNTTAPNGYDTMVMSRSPNNTYNYGSSASLWAMGQSPSYQYRTLLWFDLNPIGPPASNVQVSGSHLLLYANGAIDCTARPLRVSPLAAPFTEATNWNNQPPTTGQSWLTGTVNGGYTGCPETWVAVETTAWRRCG